MHQVKPKKWSILQSSLGMTGGQRISLLVDLIKTASKIYHSNPDTPPITNMDITEAEVLKLLKSLNENRVKYLLVGGFAVVYHGYIRTTQDLDLWIKDDAENKANLIKALKENGVPGTDLLLNTPFITRFKKVKFGKKRYLPDLMYSLKAFKNHDFDACCGRAKKGAFEGITIYVINQSDLMKEKSTASRPKDQEDLEQLREIERIRRDAKGR